MLKNITLAVLGIFLIACHNQEKPDIRVVCETDREKGSTHIKWETFPHLKGTVKIYESSRPDSFNIYSPVAETNIERGYINLFALRSFTRSYFKLLFNDKYCVITSDRNLGFRGAFNFRDLGGYYNENGRQVRWGKLYRSSSLSRLTQQETNALRNLGIKTVIDLRTENERYTFPYRYQPQRIFSLPLRGNPSATVVWFDQILSEQVKKDDVISILSDVNYYFIEYNKDYFQQMFDILTDTANYPAVINCRNGNDRTGVASALVLFALGIDWEQTLNDWLLSDELMDYYSVSGIIPEFYPENIQEVLTMLYREPLETFVYPFEKVINEYGSIDKFLETECGLTAEKKNKLRNMMLYP